MWPQHQDLGEKALQEAGGGGGGGEPVAKRKKMETKEAKCAGVSACICVYV